MLNAKELTKIYKKVEVKSKDGLGLTLNEIDEINDKLFSAITNNRFESETECMFWMEHTKTVAIAQIKKNKKLAKQKAKKCKKSDVVYEFTGVLKNGQRMDKITVKSLNSPYLPNLWNGSIWEKNVKTGKRKLIRRIYN